MNKVYTETKNMNSNDRAKLIQKAKDEYGFKNKVIGNKSNHRKEHVVINGINGKVCSVCEWQPLENYNL